MDSLPNAFDGGLVFVAEDVCLVAKPYTEYLINPYYADDDYIVEDVSDYYKEIIGVKIKGLRYESNSFATMSFENGKRLSFMSAWYDSEKKHKAGLCYIRTSKAGLKPYPGMVITEFLFTSGWNFSNECRVYHLSEIFLKISGKYYHVYSKGKHYGNHSLMIEEIPFEWAERLKRTIENKDVKIHSAGYIQDSLKWIEIKEQESYLYIRVDTFEKMYMYRSKERIEEPLEEGNYIFDKNLEKIDFIN